MEHEVRVRFAPSPTGLLHVGSFRTALFNWLFARKNNGKFILRIEDTDQKRSTKEFLESQLEDMKWMGLDWDEGPETVGCHSPYFQMQRLETYKKYADKLMSMDKVYLCYCTPDELKQAREETKSAGYSGKCRNLTPQQVEKLKDEGRKPCIRFISPPRGETVFCDQIKGEVSFENNLLDDFVIMKSNGVPTYNFAAVVDDHLMEITHVIRGDEHLSNTPRQVLLYQAMEFEPPRFVHIPIILNEDRTKLSKRKGAVHLLEFEQKGFLKEAMLNFMSLLGWAPKDDREILSKNELIESFSLDGITKHPAVFDYKKLEWINGQYITSLPTKTIVERLKPFIEEAGADPGEKDFTWYVEAISVYGNRVKTLVELADSLLCFFRDIDEYDPKGVKKHFKHDYIISALYELEKRTSEDEEFSVESLEKIIRDYSEELGVSAGKLIQPVRLAITGTTASPPIFDVMKLAGKELLVDRLHKAAKFVESWKADS
ncbi:MAG: glutamate--tRNA ligase [Candidatus Eremiobacteraeota bacterium]|nr:glutamate--tRNA ligase [Candidatus Eremiobacteraeota bacterium]